MRQFCNEITSCDLCTCSETLANSKIIRHYSSCPFDTKLIYIPSCIEFHFPLCLLSRVKQSEPTNKYL